MTNFGLVQLRIHNEVEYEEYELGKNDFSHYSISNLSKPNWSLNWVIGFQSVPNESHGLLEYISVIMQTLTLDDIFKLIIFFAPNNYISIYITEVKVL